MLFFYEIDQKRSNIVENNIQDNEIFGNKNPEISQKTSTDENEEKSKNISSDAINSENGKPESALLDETGEKKEESESTLSDETGEKKEEPESTLSDETGDKKEESKKTPEEIKAEKKKNAWRVIKYALIAMSAGAIQIISYTILSDLIKLDRHVSFEGIYQKQPWLTEIFYDPETGKTYGLSYFIALVLSVIWNFTFNRKYTFKSASNVPKAMLLVLLYYLVFTPLSCWWLVQLNKVWRFKFADKLILLGTMLINGVTEFLFQRFVVFRKSIDTAKEKEKKKSKKAGQDKNIVKT